MNELSAIAELHAVNKKITDLLMRRAALEADLLHKHATNDELQARMIISSAAIQFGVSTKEIYGRSRMKHVVRARKQAIRDVRSYTKLSLPAIGRIFGLDHTTVKHHVDK